MKPPTPTARVLLAEDDTATAAVLRHRLERDGAEVVVCTDGDAAVTLATNEPFDLAVLDTSLAGMDGFGVLQQIQATGGGLPTVMVCWPGNDALIARAFSLGAADVLVRPFSLTEARARLGRFLPRTPS